jgi:GNAT superfamily N-acetyltransferase
MNCSVVKNLQITEGSANDYRRLAVYHYRDSSLGPYAAIFTIKAVGKMAIRLSNEPVGVIVYAMPTAALELRNVALGGILSGLNRKSRLDFINENIRTISRVIIEPRFRSLGLATWLVKETIEKMDVPIIEALAVMGYVNKFFEKAGLTAYEAPMPARCEQMKEAFEFVGIAGSKLIDAESLQRKIERLNEEKGFFLERQIQTFLQSYGKRRNMPPGLERTRYVISKLTERPIYYIKIKN